MGYCITEGGVECRFRMGRDRNGSMVITIEDMQREAFMPYAVEGQLRKVSFGVGFELVDTLAL